MTTFKNLFILTTLCLITLFSTNNATAALPHFMTWDFGTYAASYDTRGDIPSPPPNGEHIFAKNKRNGNQLGFRARSGKIFEVFAKDAATGRIIVLQGATAACSSGGLCTTFQAKTCFSTPWGECFCICGAFVAPNSNNSSTAPSTNPNPNFDSSYELKNLDRDGEQVIDTDDATGARLVVKIKGGQFIEMAVRYRDGSIKVLESSRKKCFDSGPCLNFQVKYCYSTPWGDCVCVCGAFKAPSSNNSSTTPTPSFDSSYELKGLNPDGAQVIDTDDATGARLVVKIKGGQFVEMAVRYPDGSIKVLESSRKKCFDSGPCLNFQVKYCYSTPWGDCVCVCGAFKAPSRGN